ncbi:phenylalanine--tRNA ligase subunit alpha [bacterium]|nr:phenylalanine--tRNA ligase subunit alpha [bacterium]
MASENLTGEIRKIDEAFQSRLAEAKDAPSLERIRTDFLGRKGHIARLFETLGEADPAVRREAGRLLNELKNRAQSAVLGEAARVSAKESGEDRPDLTLPGYAPPVGRLHPLTIVMRRVKSCFQKLGFAVAQGPEVESDYYNFEALNIPPGHPARDMQDTLYVSDRVVLRTHTSPVQIRVMENQKPPVRIIAPGRVYRRDTPDASHSPVFHQVEGLCVDEGVSFADLKAVILAFAREMFGSDMTIRFRPSFFPFTEPSAEYDFTCVICRGKGCRVCKNTGWVEISGAGMVNPEVFRFAGIDSERYTGYAFGMGVERLTMLLYEVQDIRAFYENDLRFLGQF